MHKQTPHRILNYAFHYMGIIPFFNYRKERQAINEADKLTINESKQIQISKNMERKQLTSKQRSLLIKLIIAGLSFVLGMLPDSELLQKIIDFINNLTF